MDTHHSTRQLAGAAVLAALTVIGAWIRIPIAPVPMTLQTLFTYAAGVMLDVRYAFLCQGAYVLLGLAGVPVFASGGGIVYLTQPTFGFLLSLPLAAAVIALFIRRSRSRTWPAKLPALLFGCATIFLIGAGWLFLYFKWILLKPLSLTRMWQFSLVILLGELVKMVLAAILATQLDKLLWEKKK